MATRITDLCVVGGGLGGLVAAYTAARAGHKVLLVEQSDVLAGGETSRALGILTVMSPQYSLAQLARLHGPESAAAIVDSRVNALDFVERVCRDERIHCGFVRVSGTRWSPDYASAVEELQAAIDAGVEDASLRGDRFVRFPQQAIFEPIPFVRGLAEALQRHGGQILTRAHASPLIVDAPLAELPLLDDTGPGAVRARWVLQTSGVPLYRHFGLHAHTERYLWHSLTLVARTGGGLAPGIYWDAPPHVMMARVTPHKSRERHLHVTVSGDPHRSDKRHAGATERLLAWARERWPGAVVDGGVESEDAATAIEPADGLPFAGRVSELHRNVLIATGLGADTTNAVVTGSLLAHMASGSAPQEWVDLYDPTRLTAESQAFSIEQLEDSESQPGGKRHHQERPLPPEAPTTTHRPGRRIPRPSPFQGH